MVAGPGSGLSASGRITHPFGAAERATLSRIFAGQHFRTDLTAGQRLGREVADFVLDHFLTSQRRADDR
jgi:hypothetical protein